MEPSLQNYFEFMPGAARGSTAATHALCYSRYAFINTAERPKLAQIARACPEYVQLYAAICRRAKQRREIASLHGFTDSYCKEFILPQPQIILPILYVS